MIPRTLFDADLEGFRDSVRKFLEQEAAPYHEQWEKDGQVSRELWRKAGELGFLCPTMPEEYGGVGVDYRCLRQGCLRRVVYQYGVTRFSVLVGFALTTW